MDDKKGKVKYVDPDWEETNADLVYEMSEQYRISTSYHHFRCHLVHIHTKITLC